MKTVADVLVWAVIVWSITSLFMPGNFEERLRWPIELAKDLRLIAKRLWLRITKNRVR